MFLIRRKSTRISAYSSKNCKARSERRLFRMAVIGRFLITREPPSSLCSPSAPKFLSCVPGDPPCG